MPNLLAGSTDRKTTVFMNPFGKAIIMEVWTEEDAIGKGSGRRSASRRTAGGVHSESSASAQARNRTRSPSKRMPKFDVSFTCTRSFSPWDPDMRLTQEMEERDPNDRGIWDKCCGKFVRVRLGRLGKPV